LFCNGAREALNQAHQQAGDRVKDKKGSKLKVGKKKWFLAKMLTLPKKKVKVSEQTWTFPDAPKKVIAIADQG